MRQTESAPTVRAVGRCRRDPSGTRNNGSYRSLRSVATSAVVLLVALLSACDSAQQGVKPSVGEAVSVSIRPSSSALILGPPRGTLQLRNENKARITGLRIARQGVGTEGSTEIVVGLQPSKSADLMWLSIGPDESVTLSHEDYEEARFLTFVTDAGEVGIRPDPAHRGHPSLSAAIRSRERKRFLERYVYFPLLAAGAFWSWTWLKKSDRPGQNA